MDGVPNEVFRQELLRLLRSLNGSIKKQNAKMEGIVAAVRSLEETRNTELELVSSMKLQIEAMKLQSEAMKKQHELMDKQTENMKEITFAFKTFEKNSNLDTEGKPFPERDLKVHEPVWRAVFESAMARMMDQVERWRTGMDSTLIFVALFVTVITAFQSPVSQNLSQNPVNLTNNILDNLTAMVYEIAMLNGLKVPNGLPQLKPFRPDRTDQVLTFLWYSSLLLSLITAMISFFGRQWVEHLTKTPDGQSYKERSWRLDFREKLADKLLRPLLDSLHPILISSIFIFIVGLLYQLWSLSFSTGKPRVLILTSSLGSALILSTAAVTLYTLVHGVRWEESPFTTSTSLTIRHYLCRFVKTIPKIEDLYPLFCSAVMQMDETHHFDKASSVLFEELLESQDVSKIELAVDTVVSVLNSDASLKAKQTVAWNICASNWYIDKVDILEKTVECHRRLSKALESAYCDTPSSQRNVEQTFSMAQMIVLLRFNGERIFLINLDNEELKRVIMKIFTFDPEKCFDKKILRDAKYEAWKRFDDLEREDPLSLDDVVDVENLLPAIVREDVHDWWKASVMTHFDEEKVTNLLANISTESLKANANCFNLFKILYLVLDNCKHPLVFPDTFDLSNLIKFATSDERRFDTVCYPGQRVISPVDILLSYLSLVASNFHACNRHLSEFLESLDGLDSGRPGIRDGLAPANITELRNQLIHKVKLPIGLIDLKTTCIISDVPTNNTCTS